MAPYFPFKLDQFSNRGDIKVRVLQRIAAHLFDQLLAVRKSFSGPEPDLLSPNVPAGPRLVHGTIQAYSQETTGNRFPRPQDVVE
jgi:hypothetical protein